MTSKLNLQQADKNFYQSEMELCEKWKIFVNRSVAENFQCENFSGIAPCESSRPEVSENVVLFGRASFLTGVIAGQSQIMSAKVEASPKLGGVKKKDTATILIFRA